MPRNRKAIAARHPAGRLVLKLQPNLPAPIEVRRLRDLAIRKACDPIYGSELGQLYANGQITDSQFSAGKKWGTLVRDYDAACLAPKAPESVTLDAKGGEPGDPDSEQGLSEARRHRFVTEQYLGATAMLKLAGGPPQRVLEAVCERGEYCPAFERKDLRTALDILDGFWSSKREKKSRSSAG